MQMDVRVDAARHHDVSGGVDHGAWLRRPAPARDGGDRFAVDREIAAHDALRRHDVAAANDEIEHCSSRG